MAGPEYNSNVVNPSHLKNILRVPDENWVAKPQNMVNSINPFEKVGIYVQKIDISTVLDRLTMLREDGQASI